MALFATACCAGVFILCIVGLGRIGADAPVFVRIMFWIVMPAMIWGGIAYSRRLLDPPLMYLADGRGVMIHCDTSRGTLPEEGVFLPWDIVAEMSFEERRGVGYMTNRTSIRVVKCTLSGDAPFPVGKHSVGYLPEDGNRVVCLDAFNGNISGQSMLEKIRPIWQSAINRGKVRDRSGD
jgi:hypothetical protein